MIFSCPICVCVSVSLGPSIFPEPLSIYFHSQLCISHVPPLLLSLFHHPSVFPTSPLFSSFFLSLLLSPLPLPFSFLPLPFLSLTLCSGCLCLALSALSSVPSSMSLVCPLPLPHFCGLWPPSLSPALVNSFSISLSPFPVPSCWLYLSASLAPLSPMSLSLSFPPVGHRWAPSS